jgi:hypothetical protein
VEKTFVYLCKNGDNEELRYSLRSVEKFFPGSKVWVVGGKPDWYVGDFIAVPSGPDVFENVRKSLSAIAANDSIPDDVVIMNDDFFFVRSMESIPCYISGTLRDRIMLNKANGVNSSYVRRLVQSYKHCKKIKSSPLDFDIHVPMPIKKNNLKEVVNDSIMWRSNYGNRFIKDTETIKINDVKVYVKQDYSFKSYDFMSLEYPFFSTSDDAFGLVYERLLANLLPQPSSYEAISDMR